MSDLIDLDDLWTDVLVQAAPKPQAKAVSEDPGARYTKAENWQRTRCIALIHAETQTLLGNFSEYLHRTVAGCRKLCRESLDMPATAVELVSGSWWIDPCHRPEPVHTWHTSQEIFCHVYLRELQVHAPAVALTVFKSYGSIARVELAQPTRFAQWHEGGASGETILDLPQGTNVWEVLSRDTRIRIQEETA